MFRLTDHILTPGRWQTRKPGRVEAVNIFVVVVNIFAAAILCISETVRPMFAGYSPWRDWVSPAGGRHRLLPTRNRSQLRRWRVLSCCWCWCWGGEAEISMAARDNGAVDLEPGPSSVQLWALANQIPAFSPEMKEEKWKKTLVEGGKMHILLWWFASETHYSLMSFIKSLIINMMMLWMQVTQIKYEEVTGSLVQK